MFSHFLRKVLPFKRRGARTTSIQPSLGGLIWRVTPDAAPFFGSDDLDLNRWLSDPRTEVVKTGPHRSVYRVRLANGTVYIKHCRVGGIRAWAREVLRPAKARLEFENALSLQTLGIAAVIPLAWGSADSRWPGESYLITRSQEGVDPFVHFIESTLPRLPAQRRARLRRRIAAGLGTFMADLHDGGVAHPDPHPGNLLLELGEDDVPRFFLIDLHAVRYGPPLNWSESRANLVLYNRWFQLRATHADRHRFWQSYIHRRQTLSHSGLDPIRELERGTQASNVKFWSGRVSRCLRTNRYFRCLSGYSINGERFRGHAVRDLPENVIEWLLSNPDAPFTLPKSVILKDSPSSTVVEYVLTLANGPMAVVLKRVAVRNRLDPFKNLVRRSPVLRSWIAGHALRDRLLPTPRPLAVMHRIRNGLPREGYLLVEKAPAALELPKAVASSHFDPEWLLTLARTIRSMHDRGISNRDMKAANILIEMSSHPMPTFIDLVGVRMCRAVSFERRVKELARLNASFLASSQVTNNHRYRFLKSYLSAGARHEMGWKIWWNAVSRATALKVKKNRRGGRGLA